MCADNVTDEYWLTQRGLNNQTLRRLLELAFERKSVLLHDSTAEEVLFHCRALNIQPLLYDVIRKGRMDGLEDEPWFSALRADALMIGGASAHWRKILTHTVLQLAENGVRPIWFKGPALAFSVYPSFHWRTYQDLDLLIESSQWDSALQGVKELGYMTAPCLNWGSLSFERCFVPRVKRTSSLSIELHLRLNNRSPLCAFEYDELLEDAVTPEGIDFPFLMPDPVKHLIIVCLHRMGHHASDRRFAWILDMYFLIQNFSTADWKELLVLAEQKKVATVLAHNLKDMQRITSMVIPQQVLEKMDWIAQTHVEPSAIYTKDRRSKGGDFFRRWMEIPSFKDKGAYLLRWLCPPQDYMDHVYGRKHPLRQYGDRIRCGIKKYL
jgi:hypothetical protein